MKLSKDQARAVAAYLLAVEALAEHENSASNDPYRWRALMRRNEAWAVCRAMGVLVLSDGRIAVDNGKSSTGG